MTSFRTRRERKTSSPIPDDAPVTPRWQSSIVILPVLSSVALLATCSGWRESALHQGDSLQRDLKPGEAHVYLVPLAVGESALIVVNQMGVDVVVEVRDPAGKIIASVDSPNGRKGDEPVLLEADSHGTFTLRVRAIDANEPAAKYSLRYAWRRSARATEAALHASQQWLTRHTPERGGLENLLRSPSRINDGEVT